MKVGFVGGLILITALLSEAAQSTPPPPPTEKPISQRAAEDTVGSHAHLKQTNSSSLSSNASAPAPFGGAGIPDKAQPGTAHGLPWKDHYSSCGGSSFWLWGCFKHVTSAIVLKQTMHAKTRY